MVVALGGAIWLWQKERQPDPRVAQLSTELVAVRKELEELKIAPTPAPTVAPVPTPKPSKNYFPPEKVELGNLLSYVSDQLTGKGLAAFNFASNMHAHPMQTKDQIDQFIAQTDAARSLLADMSSNLGSSIISNNPKYVTELKALIGWSAAYGNMPVDRFVHNLTHFRNDLAEYQQRFDQMSDPDRVWIRAMLTKEAHAVREDAVINFRKWVQECSDKIDAQRDSLR
jgi:hypothetical protein